MIDRIAEGRTDLVFEWLAGGGSPTAANEHGTTLIQWCAHHGDVSAIRHLLAHGVALADLGPNLDLNGAVFHGHGPLCEFLIERGADVNFPLPGTGETPLHSALCKTDRRFNVVLKLLLDAGANPNVATVPGIETDSFMRDIRTRGETPLHRAAAFADADAIRMLRNAGAAADTRDAHGDTPLTWASWHLRPREILRLLVYGPHRA